MKVRFNKTTWQAIGSVIASSLLLVSFQNCGKAGFDSNLDEALDSSSSDAALVAKYGEATAEKVQAIPFAFDAGFDTISYNSCAGKHLRNNSAFVSLKAGAYSTAGIRIRNDFFGYIDQNFKPTYPETAISENQYKEFLADSPQNSKAVAVSAVRTKVDLSRPYILDGSSSASLNKEVIPLVGTLTDSFVMDAFVKKGVTANYFPFSQEYRVLEAGFNFNSDDNRADAVRGEFANSAILALTFMKEQGAVTDVLSNSDSEVVRSAYGRGYSLSFVPYPVAGAHPSNPNRVLASVTELDLMAPGVAMKQWSCRRAYKIFRSEDAAATCPSHTYAEIKNNPAIREELSIFRRHFRADQWDVNVVLGCAVPLKKSGSCYDEKPLTGQCYQDSSGKQVCYPIAEYDLSKECYIEDKQYAGMIPTSRCQHFLSICTRD